MNRNKLFFVISFIFAIFLSTILLTGNSRAANSATFNPGRIIDDGVFTNKASMSAQDIQIFLNSKVNSCNTGYTCLKDYIENGKSASQIIWEQSQNYNINPQVIIVTLQKENGLVTDTFPQAWQYRTAMGFACPDSGSCDPAYYGFTNQVGQGARHFRNYFDNNPNWFIPYTPGASTIKWSPNASCGSSQVFIENRSTAALYSYTPYQPNQAALNNLYGLGDNCSAYGNRNFWRDFTDWFGSTNSTEFITQVIQAPNDSRYFLRIGNTKMWIPTTETYSSWRLSSFSLTQVPQSFFDSLATLPDLKQVGRAGPYYYFVSNGEKHYIPTLQHLQNWGYTQQDINNVSATLVLNNIPETNHLGRFAKSSDSNDQRHWLMNSSQKNNLPNNDILYQWGYIPSNEITTTPEYLTLKSIGPDASRFVSSSGSKYIIDTNRKIILADDNQVANWGSPAFTEISSLALGFVQSITSSNFIKPANDPKWYLLDGGNKRYLPDGNVLNTWNYTNNLLVISQNLGDLLPSANNARSIIRVTSPVDKTFVLDGKKHWIPDQNTLNAWENDSSTIDIYNPASISGLIDSTNASAIFQIQGTPHIYTVEAESIRHIPDINTLNAWGYPRVATITSLSQSFVYQYQQTTSVSFKVDTGVAKYFLEDGYSHLVPDNMLNTWGFSTPAIISPNTISRFSSKPSVTQFVNIGGINYIMEGGQRIALGGFDDAYGVNSGNVTNLNTGFFNQSSLVASYIIQSNNPADSRIWLFSKGKKYYIESFAKLVNYGFISRQIPITKLSQQTIDSFTDAGKNAPIFLKKAGSGTKMINFGTGAGFPDLSIKATYGSTMSTDELVSASIFDSLPLQSYLQSIARGYDGKIYLIENGQKRWITNSQTYQNNYANLPNVLLYSTTLEMIPNGTNIN
ncbi:hypothetical protein H0W80_03795 [Candidatus Saccharibacteria bacterium]|nr:hypothetical protein [Candidatus Saccharibacteria bacterium]